jgi:hypothetical protein
VKNNTPLESFFIILADFFKHFWPNKQYVSILDVSSIECVNSFIKTAN